MEMDPKTLFDLDLTRLQRGQLALYNRLLDEHARTGRRSSQEKWRMGTVIRFIRDEKVYAEQGLDDFPQWVRQRCGFDVVQADRYVQIADLPYALLQDQEIDVHRLLAVRTKEPLFWPPLLTAAGEGASEAQLNRAARAGGAHLLRHRDEQAACAHALAVARGEADPVKAADRPRKPGEVGRALVRALRGKSVQGRLSYLRQLRTQGQALQGKWFADLAHAAEALCTEVAELTELPADPAEGRDAPAGAVEGGELTARVNLEKMNSDDGLDMKKRAPAPAPEAPPGGISCPDPCPLCGGQSQGTQRGVPVHQPGCALLPGGRRCRGCGQDLSVGGHLHLCAVRMMQDDRHAHTWRCVLDPLCVHYRGSPLDPGFKLPPAARTGGADRPWLYAP